MATARKPLVPLSVLLRWLLPGMALLLCVASWIRFAQVAANNKPPLRLIAMGGDGSWLDHEVLRARCGLTAQFLAEGDRAWLLCAPGPDRWELIRWNFRRGVAERKWQARTSPKDSSHAEVVRQQRQYLPPLVAGALRLPGGDLALVVHGYKSLTPVELVVVRHQGGLTHHLLPTIKPGALTGFAYRKGRYELLTADCRRHVLEPGKPLLSAPLAGCPYDNKTVLEWSQHTDKGWRFVYARQARRAGHYALFLVEPGSDKARAVGTLREATGTRMGEKLDLSQGNVLPVGRSQRPSHRLIKGALTPLPEPPRSLVAGFQSLSRAGGLPLLGDDRRMRRLWMYHAITVAPSAGAPAGTEPPRGGSVSAWRWLSRQPTRWIAGESRGRTLRLLATAPDRQLDHALAGGAPTVLRAMPATDGGTWLFTSHGAYLKVDDGLRRTDAPGIGQRIRRIWRLHHLQRNHVSFHRGRVVKRSALRGLAHRSALPVVLLGLPLLCLLALPLAHRSGRRRSADHPLRASLAPPVALWILTGATYLLLAGALLWSFWEVTTVF